MENLLNINQVAFILKVHPLTIRRYIREEKLPAVKVGGNVRIQESEIGKFTKKFTVTHKRINPIIEKQSSHLQTFGADDPFLRLKGRGASLTQRYN